jgi:hypothetical protein
MPGRFHRLSAEAAIPPFDDWNGALDKLESQTFQGLSAPTSQPRCDHEAPRLVLFPAVALSVSPSFERR